MALNINIEDLGESKSQPLTPGAYEFIIAGADEGVTANGDPKVTLTLEIENGGRIHKLSFVTVSFGPNAMKMARQFMETIGVTKITDASALIGKRGWTTTTTEEKDGNVYARQQWWGKPFKSNENARAAAGTPKDKDKIPF